MNAFELWIVYLIFVWLWCPRSSRRIAYNYIIKCVKLHSTLILTTHHTLAIQQCLNGNAQIIANSHHSSTTNSTDSHTYSCFSHFFFFFACIRVHRCDSTRNRLVLYGTAKMKREKKRNENRMANVHYTLHQKRIAASACVAFVSIGRMCKRYKRDRWLSFNHAINWFSCINLWRQVSSRSQRTRARTHTLHTTHSDVITFFVIIN